MLRSLGEGIDTSNASGRMVAGVLASLAELELELGRERRTAARDVRRARGQSIGRPKALDQSKVGLAQPHACQWRIGQHDCGHTWREPRHRLQSACRRRLARPRNQATNCDVARAPRRIRARGGFE